MIQVFNGRCEYCCVDSAGVQCAMRVFEDCIFNTDPLGACYALGQAATLIN